MHCKQLRFRGREFYDAHLAFGKAFLAHEVKVEGKPCPPEVIMHCVNVSDAVYERTGNERLALMGLFHTLLAKHDYEGFAAKYNLFLEIAGSNQKFRQQIGDALQKVQGAAYVLNPLVCHDLSEFHRLDAMSPVISHSDEDYVRLVKDLPTAVLVRMCDVADIVHFPEDRRAEIFRYFNASHDEKTLGMQARSVRSIYRPIANRLGWSRLYEDLLRVELEGTHNTFMQSVDEFFRKNSERLEGLRSAVEGMLRQILPEEAGIKSDIKKAPSTALKLVEEKERYPSGNPKDLNDLVRFYVLADTMGFADYSVEKILDRYDRVRFERVPVSEEEQGLKEVFKGDPDKHLPSYRSFHILFRSKMPDSRGFKVEIQVKVKEEHERFHMNGIWAHEIYKGGKLDADLLGRIPSFVRVFELERPDPRQSEVLVPMSVPVRIHLGAEEAAYNTVIPLWLNATIADLIGTSTGFYRRFSVTDSTGTVLRRLDSPVINGETYNIHLDSDGCKFIGEGQAEKLIPDVTTYPAAVQLLDIITNGNHADPKSVAHRKRRNHSN